MVSGFSVVLSAWLVVGMIFEGFAFFFSIADVALGFVDFLYDIRMVSAANARDFWCAAVIVNNAWVSIISDGFGGFNLGGVSCSGDIEWFLWVVFFDL